MKPTVIFTAFAVVTGAAAAWPKTPTTPAASNTNAYCTWWKVAKKGDTCASMVDKNWISLAQFLQYNPSIAKVCNLIVGNSYCVESNWGFPVIAKPVTTTTTKTSTKSGTTTSPVSIATPSPTQPGMVKACDVFYLVKSGDTCDLISKSRGVSVADIIKFNPGVGTSCTALWLNYYVCISIVGHSLTTTTTTTKTTTTTTSKKPTTTTGNGVTTPTPFQSGMATRCKTFHLVKAGENCATIAKAFGISTATFIQWNPAANSGCTNLWLNTYACVALI